MKIKSLLSITFLSALMFASCAEKEIAEPQPSSREVGEDGLYSYVFALSSEDTKTIYGPNYLIWEEGDIAGSYAEHGGSTVSSNKSSSVTLGQDHAIIHLKSSVPLSAGDKAYFYFPYSSGNNSNEPSALSLQIPAEQVSGDADAMPMVAVPFTLTGDVAGNTDTEVGKLQFVNLGSVIKLNIYSSTAAHQGEVVEGVTFDASVPVAGTFTYDITNLNPDAVVAISGYDKTRVNVSAREDVGSSEAEGGVIYMVVAPGEYMGSFVVHTDKADYTYTSDKNRTFARAGLKSFNFDLATNNWDESTGYDTNIDSPRELAAFLAGTSESDTQSYTITANLDMTGYANLNASGFSGTLDGGNHTISNYTSDKPMFTTLKGTIKNLTLEGEFNAASQIFGAFAKEAIGVTFNNVINKAPVTFTAKANISGFVCLGGFVGAVKGGSFTDCTNSGAVTLEATGFSHDCACVAGYAGYAYDHVSFITCKNDAPITDNAVFGNPLTPSALFGHNGANAGNHVAGFVGRTNSSTGTFPMNDTESKNNGQYFLSCENTANGVITMNHTDISKLGSNNTLGNMTCAGIIGVGSTYIYKCNNNGNINVSAVSSTGGINKAQYLLRVGGIQGNALYYTYVGSSNNNANVNVVNDSQANNNNIKASVGGVVGCGGYNAVSVGSHADCYYDKMNGNITVSGRGKCIGIGGILGHDGSQIHNTVSANTKITCTLSGGDVYVGGLVGSLAGSADNTSIKACTSSAKVNVESTGSDVVRVGGMIGYQAGANGSYLVGKDNESCAFLGSVTSATMSKYVGFIVGQADGSTATKNFGEKSFPIRASGTFARKGMTPTVITSANIDTYKIGTGVGTVNFYLVSDSEPANLMTFNIRSDSNWGSRKSAIVEMILDQKPIIVGLQEVKKLDMSDLISEGGGTQPWEYLTSNLTGYTGVQDSASNQGYFYDTDRVEVSNTGTFSMQDSEYTRKVLYATIKDKTCDRNYFFMTTHLPLNPTERATAVALIKSKITELNTNSYPVIVMGDCNGVRSEACFTDFEKTYNNTRYVAMSYVDNTNVNRDLYTYNAFGDSTKSRQKIDHIWVSKSVKVLYYVTLTQEIKKYGSVEYLSDHYPVIATIS